MPKNKKIFKKTILTPSRIIIGVLSVIILFLLFVIYTLYQINMTESTQTMKTLITSAATKQLYSPVANAEGRVTIPGAEASVTFSEDLMVGISDGSSIFLTNQPALTSSENNLSNTDINKLFDGVPLLQACTRQVTIMLDNVQPDEDSEFVLSKKLSDGRTAKIYRSTKCTQNIEKTLEAAKSIQSL